jgi:ornithine cyclodeaminase/alanine dehydrogenase-like protein (mu-crystallin family)
MDMRREIDQLAARAPDLFRDILRISPEPYQYFDERQVHDALTLDPAGYVSFVRDRLQAVAMGRSRLELPPKQLFVDPCMAGDFRVMPCVLWHEEQVTKTVKIVGTNLAQTRVPDQITVGKAFALDPSDNFINYVFEACLLSSARTGLCASLAMDRLAGDTDTVAIIGAGRVGYYAGLYANAVRRIRLIELYDTVPGRAEALAEQLQRDLRGKACRLLASPASDAADVMILATSSTDPVCHPTEVNASLVISLGADTDAQHELAEDWVDAADVYVDTRDSARYGDIRQWQAAGRVQVGALTDLFALLREPDVPGERRRRVFISTGSAIFDNLTIAYLLSRQAIGG